MLLTSLSKMAIFLMKSKRCFQGYRDIFILFKNLCPEFWSHVMDTTLSISTYLSYLHHLDYTACNLVLAVISFVFAWHLYLNFCTE